MFPVNKFEWIKDASQFNEDFIKNHNEENDDDDDEAGGGENLSPITSDGYFQYC